MIGFNNWAHVIDQEIIGVDEDGLDVAVEKHLLVDQRKNPIASFEFSVREDAKNALRAAVAHNFCSGFSSEWLTQRHLGGVFEDVIKLVETAVEQLNKDDISAAKDTLNKVYETIFSTPNLKRSEDESIQISLNI